MAKIGRYLQLANLPYFILGNGSNLLAPDEGFQGWVINLQKLNLQEESLGDTRVKLGASVSNARALRFCAGLGLSGIEFLCGVPGTIGGAVFMNAGTGEGWISEVTKKVTGFRLDTCELVEHTEDLEFSYRCNLFLKEHEIVFSAEFALNQSTTQAVRIKLKENTLRRRKAQPLDLPSCGSVFRNPSEMPAWKCVEEVGLRGKKIGGARISPKHANFIVNEGGASFQDVIALIDLIKNEVKAKLGISLQQELVVMRPKFL